MAGIYIHIPFCRKACHYCNFHFSTNMKTVDQVTTAIIKEIDIRSKYLTEPISTLYFGGGTPSVIQPQYLNRIVQALKTHFLLEVEEMCLEANPDDVNPEVLDQWQNMGFNRLSLGIQSFQDKHLKWMNRSHNRQQAIVALEQIQRAGIPDYTVDLIYGFSGLSEDDLIENLSIVTAMSIPHISAYGMTIEPKTALGYQTRQGTYIPLNDEDVNEQMRIVIDTLGKSGYIHYEISNFAQPGRQALHNTNYWNGKNYLGLGPGAHSFNGVSRQWNIANNQKYVKLMQDEQPFYELEHLSPQDQYNEFVMTRLRMAQGIRVQELKRLYPDYYVHFTQEITPFMGNQVNEVDGFIMLTNKGKYVADHIISSLFYAG